MLIVPGAATIAGVVVEKLVRSEPGASLTVAGRLMERLSMGHHEALAKP